MKVTYEVHTVHLSLTFLWCTLVLLHLFLALVATISASKRSAGERLRWYVIGAWLIPVIGPIFVILRLRPILRPPVL